MSSVRVLSVVLGLVFGAAACAQATSSPRTAPAASEGSAVIQAPLPSEPDAVDIPAIGVHVDKVMDLRLNADRTIQTPDVKTPEVLGWYALGVLPCQTGPFVVAGHVDGGGRKGIFYRLKELKSDDTVTITTKTGVTCTYRIDSVIVVQKNSFPTERVYGNTPNAQIRLITCGGPFIGNDRGGYRDNLIAVGTLQQ